LEAHALVARLAGHLIKHENTSLSPVPPASCAPPSITTSVESAPSSSSLSPSVDSDPASLSCSPAVNYPFLALLVSGGHTSLLLCHSIGNYEFLGGTLDDALGEAFDKAARLLNLNISLTSGGPVIEKMASLYHEKYAKEENFQQMKHALVVPMRDKNNFDFSYSGIMMMEAFFLVAYPVSHFPLFVSFFSLGLLDVLI
jgi:hypothetical protein